MVAEAEGEGEADLEDQVEVSFSLLASVVSDAYSSLLLPVTSGRCVC